ncbi:MAG: histidine kinase [Firmicutes bacterium HGW-Firmicutes-12]|nr:MAG: histidine kinase [Firmicutes bacterium HGW-Firmicutes-12]
MVKNMFEAFEEIFVHLMKHMSVILILVIILSRFKIFKNLMLKKTTNLEKYILMVFFGLISIIGTYGFNVENAIANTRAVGVIVAGLVSGPVVGIGAALIAGVHRYYLGGFTVNAAFVSVVLQGFLAGMYYKKIHKRNNKWFYAMILAALLEVLHFIIVILMSRPVLEALEIVKLIGPPMILINAIGVGIFVAVLENIYNEHGRIEATATQLVLKIANRTLPYLRQGLNNYSAQKAAEIILEMVDDLAAVAFISQDALLAFVGKGSEFHSPLGKDMHTKNILDVMKSGDYLISQKKEEIGCPESDCPLKSQMIVLLHEKDKVVGALGIYKTDENSITSFEIELALGLGQLFSTQIEISKVHQKSALLAQAEIMALQAQINPHFLFNALNTIVYYCRKKPETARDLLIHLGDFYRNNLMKSDMMIDLMTEIKHVDSYVKIEMARFGERLKVHYEIDSMCKCMVPSLILQPIVENAIKHGILPNKIGGVITVSGSISANNDRCVLTVEDNGVGMQQNMVDKLLEYNAERKSIGLCNVHSRLKNFYGENYGLNIESWPGRGTRVTIPIPLGKEVR